MINIALKLKIILFSLYFFNALYHRGFNPDQIGIVPAMVDFTD
jgi:hypothetical protein